MSPRGLFDALASYSKSDEGRRSEVGPPRGLLAAMNAAKRPEVGPPRGLLGVEGARGASSSTPATPPAAPIGLYRDLADRAAGGDSYTNWGTGIADAIVATSP